MPRSRHQCRERGISRGSRLSAGARRVEFRDDALHVRRVFDQASSSPNSPVRGLTPMIRSIDRTSFSMANGLRM